MRHPYGDPPRPWERFERTISHYTLEPGPRDPLVEGMRFPGLVSAYRSQCPSWDVAPTQADYAAWVQHLVWCACEPGGRLPDARAVQARAGRAYISLVVQHHAYLVLQDTFGATAWDDDLDMRYGVDLIAIGNDAVAVGLALRAPTKRSRELAARKAERYGSLPFKVQVLEVEPYGYTAGPFWLYRPETLVGAVMHEVRRYWDRKARDLAAAAGAAYLAGLRRPKASRRDFMDGVAAALDALRESAG